MTIFTTFPIFDPRSFTSEETLLPLESADWFLFSFRDGSRKVYGLLWCLLATSVGRLQHTSTLFLCEYRAAFFGFAKITSEKIVDILCTWVVWSWVFCLYLGWLSSSLDVHLGALCLIYRQEALSNAGISLAGISSADLEKNTCVQKKSMHVLGDAHSGW